MLRICAMLVAAMLATLALPERGHAVFPGENGLLTFSRLAPGDLTGQVAIAEATKDAEVTILTTEGLLNADSRFSPDGSCIVFYSERDAGDQELYAMDVDGGNQTRLTVHPAFDYYGVYSPDGTRLAFVSDRDGDYEIYTFDLANGAVTQLTSNTAVDYIPAWSPDGTTIAFSSNRDGNFEIYSMTATGSNQTRLTESSGLDAYPDFSPDGKSIVFATVREGTMDRDIWQMDADGNGESPLITRAGFDSDPVFSPDGTKVAFSCIGLTGTHICIGNSADGSDVFEVTTAGLVDDRGPDWQALNKLPPVTSLCPKVTPKLCGDANSDAAVKTSDALATLRRAVGQQVVCPHIRCDVDNNGSVLASDAQRILKFAVGQPLSLECPDEEPPIGV